MKELNKEMLIAEFTSLLNIAKFTDNDFITSPFRKEFLEYALALIKELTEDVEWAAKRIKEADKKILNLTKANNEYQNENMVLSGEIERLSGKVEWEG